MGVYDIGTGYFIAQDTTGDTLKIYYSHSVDPSARILQMAGIVWNDGNEYSLDVDSGPAFDNNATFRRGYVSTALPGSPGYAATLPDSETETEQEGGNQVESLSTQNGSDGTWVYLTGQVVTYSNSTYYANENGAYRNIFNVEDPSRSSAVRVYSPSSTPGANTVVDVMAKLTTSDGQRMLGIFGSDVSVERRPSVQQSGSSVVGIAPTFMTEKSLVGAKMGFNPGATGGLGLNNAGSYVRISGKVLDSGTTSMGVYSIPYMRLDDGSGISSPSTPTWGTVSSTASGVYVFGTNTKSNSQAASTGDYVAVAGVSSIFAPTGSSGTLYPCLWAPSASHCDDEGDNRPTSRQIVAAGSITGKVKLYDMPNGTATVRVYCSSGALKILTVTRNDSAGSLDYQTGEATYAFDNVPSAIQWDEGSGTSTSYPTYIVSAESDGFKTRTYTNVSPGGTQNLYLTALRKMYLTSGATGINLCSGSGATSATITAVVRDANHNQCTSPLTIKFRTNIGSFSSSGVARECNVTTSTGSASVTFYSVPGEWGRANIIATDDSAPRSTDYSGTDPFATNSGDPYAYDWEPLRNSSGSATYVTVRQPDVALQLAAPAVSVCDNQEVITATLTACGAGMSGTVHFSTDAGTFAESNQISYDASADSAGHASATLLRPVPCEASSATVQAYGTVTPAAGDGIPVDSTHYPMPSVAVHWPNWKLKVTVSPDWVVAGNPANVKAKLTLDDGSTPVAGEQVMLTTDIGTFNPHDHTPTENPQRYTATTNSAGEINTTLTVSGCPLTATVTGSEASCTGTCIHTDSDTLLVICSGSDAKTLIIALDGTSSMGMGATAGPGLTTLLSDLKAAGIALNVAGVKFSDTVAAPDMNQPEERRSVLSLTNDYDKVIRWVTSGAGADGGGDVPENDLLGLMTAKNLGTVGCYIALATDNPYHYAGDPWTPQITDLTADGVIAALSAGNCKVYIDARGEVADACYTTPNPILYVNGALEDWNIPPGSDHYEFPKLEAAIRGQ